MTTSAGSRLRILVLGASGFLGTYLYHRLRHRHIALGTYHSNRAPGLQQLDLTDACAVQQLTDDFQPNLILHCAGVTRPDACETDTRRAYQINVLGTQCVLNATSARIVYFSTDYVFDGERGGYSEYDEPSPINYYGQTKLQAERLVLSASDQNLVVRVAGLYGFNRHNNEFIRSLLADEPLLRAADLVGSQTLLADVAAALEALWDRDGGIFHVAGAPPESRYAFTTRAVRALGLPTPVVSCNAEELRQVARRPRDSSLISRRHQLTLHSSEEGLAMTAAEWRVGGPSRESTVGCRASRNSERSDRVGQGH